ncbi:efflux RND transporter permease subunit [Myxococcota bacterium]|nr:efflux RND transporter permease subunit [Myxococcota bacterium]MBU1536687.1 efflux RND transporter permease subunit [Myxococcota bacterium]
MKFSEFSLKKPAVILLLFAGFSAYGLYTYKNISRREDPKIEISWAAIFTIYPGASAQEVEKKVTRPIEEALESISTIEEIKSNSRNNVSFIMLKVNYNSNFQQQWDVVRARIDSIRGRLPSTVQGPKVIDDFGDVVSMIVSVEGDKKDPKTMKTLADQLKERLLSISSVGKVEMLGQREEEIAISGSLDDFLNYDFTPITAQRLLTAQNMGLPGGIYHTPTADIRLAPPTEYSKIKELKNQIFAVSPKTGEPLTLGKVFSIKQRYKDPQNTYYRTNGKSSIILNITMKKGFDVTKMGIKVRAVLATFSRTLPEGIRTFLVHDQPIHVDKNLGDFIDNLYQSVIIVALAMAVLLGIGSSLLVALGLPLAILVSLVFMPLVGVDLERASVAAFIIALGMLVDNSIIVIDHIHNHLDAGTPLKESCIKGGHELILPILGGTIASILAFFPLVLLPDEMGAYIKALPWVLTLSLSASFFISVTFTPLCAYAFLRFGAGSREKKRQKRIKEGNRESLFGRVYRRIMAASLTMWPLVILLALGAFGGSLYLAGKLGVSFFPNADRDQFTIDIWTPEGSSVASTDEKARAVEKLVQKDPRVVSTLTTVGVGLPRFTITHLPELNSFNLAQMMVNTTSPQASRDLVRELSEKTKHIPGVRIVPKEVILGIGLESPIAIKVKGDDIVELRRISQEIQRVLLDTEGILSVRDNFGSDALAYKIRVDEEKAFRIGVTRLDIALALITAANGMPVATWRAEDDPMEVVLELDRSQVKSSDDLKRMYVRSQATGGAVPLSSFVTFEPQWEVGKIHRSDGRRAIIVHGYLKQGVLANGVLKRALPRIRSIAKPAGYELLVEGEEKERTKTFGDLTRIFIITVFALFFVLVLQFGTFLQAIVILGSIPLAVIGAVLGLYFTNNSFGFSAFLGVIALAGIVIKNAVVWVEFVVTEVARGMEYREAVIKAGITRLRPILLTAATTIGGLFPLALWGGVMWNPMAWTMIFGLAVSTVLTLVVIPVIYYKVVTHRPPQKEKGEVLPC